MWQDTAGDGTYVKHSALITKIYIFHMGKHDRMIIPFLKINRIADCKLEST